MYMQRPHVLITFNLPKGEISSDASTQKMYCMHQGIGLGKLAV